LPFDFAQGGELVEPFVIWCLDFSILQCSITPAACRIWERQLKPPVGGLKAESCGPGYLLGDAKYYFFA
jgi:hypothetical protein